jgi:hypothetical protein
VSFDIRATGDWGPAQVTAQWVPSTRTIHPEVEHAIETAWSLASSRKGIHLFDGPMCRLEHWTPTPYQLDLSLSRTSYKSFLGTNLHNAHLADQFGVRVLANPVGLSTIVGSTDGWLLLGRRSSAVAYYPDRIHPFAGALEPAETLDVFAEVRRELREELSMGPSEIDDIRCIGLVEDRSLRQPELIFLTRSPLTRGQIESNLDPAEHRSVFAVAADRDDVRRVVSDPFLTPVAAAALTLWLDGSDLPPGGDARTVPTTS